MVIDWHLQHYVQSKIHVHVGCMMAGKLQISSAWTNIEKYSTILN